MLAAAAFSAPARPARSAHRVPGNVRWHPRRGCRRRSPAARARRRRKRATPTPLPAPGAAEAASAVPLRGSLRFLPPPGPCARTRRRTCTETEARAAGRSRLVRLPGPRGEATKSREILGAAAGGVGASSVRIPPTRLLAPVAPHALRRTSLGPGVHRARRLMMNSATCASGSSTSSGPCARTSQRR